MDECPVNVCGQNAKYDPSACDMDQCVNNHDNEDVIACYANRPMSMITAIQPKKAKSSSKTAPVTRFGEVGFYLKTMQRKGPSLFRGCYQSTLGFNLITSNHQQWNTASKRSYCSGEKDEDDGPSEAREAYYDNYMKMMHGTGAYPTYPQTTYSQTPTDITDTTRKTEGSLTHTDSSGKASMVDVGHKDVTFRRAVASCSVLLGSEAFRLVKANKTKKGDVLTVAQIAGIMTAKNTSNLIPLCHNIGLSKVDVTLTLQEADDSVLITCGTRTRGQTGVEMEALVGATMAALTVYDMCKAVTHDIIITDVKLLEKDGGQSGSYRRQ